MESEEAGCEYIEFDNLSEINDGFSNVWILLQSNSWRENFSGLNQLRSINKYHRGELVEILNRSIDQISTLVDSPRSSLAKNALMFISECFSSYDSSLIHHALKLSQLLLIKSTNEKSFIRIKALEGLENLSNNYYNEPEIVSLFQSNCFHKSANMSQNAFNYLKIMLKKMQPLASLEICLAMGNCKRQSILIGITEHIKYLSINWLEFQQAVSGLSERHKKIVEVMLAEKKKRSSLKEAIENAKSIKSYTSCDQLSLE